MPVVAAPSLDRPELAPYRTLRRAEEHIRHGIFVAEGPPVVEALLGTDLEVVSALLTPAWGERLAARLAARPGDPPVFVAPEALFGDIVGFRFHQGALAVARVPALRPLADRLAELPPPRLVVALDDLTLSENVGAVARSCAALGAGALLTGETCASPWLRRSVRASMGAVFRLSTHASDDLAATLADLGAQGFRTVAAAPHAAASIHDADLSGDCCLVFGHEGRGVRPHVQAACTEARAIPMAAGLDSLNVAMAASVFLYEAARQRR